MVSIVGPWGSGKTRVLQMLAEELNGSEDFTGQVIPFNPWLFSGSDQLTAYFFLSLAEALPEQFGPTSSERLAERLRRYGRALGTIRALPGVGGIAGATADVMAEAADRTDTSAADLAERRDQVVSALQELDLHLVVIIDDVDRLQLASEIQDLMRMVKLVGDLPGVTYVLSYDRRPVVDALKTKVISGEEYLEKIVQIEYRLPDPPKLRLQKMLDGELTQATTGIPNDRLDASRWPEIYERVIQPLVQTPRQVRRVGNAARLSVDLHGADVDLADQLAMAALATTLPAFHDALPGLADDLMPKATTFARLFREKEPGPEKERLQGAINESGRPEVARAALRVLFHGPGFRLKASSRRITTIEMPVDSVASPIPKHFGPISTPCCLTTLSALARSVRSLRPSMIPAA